MNMKTEMDADDYDDGRFDEAFYGEAIYDSIPDSVEQATVVVNCNRIASIGEINCLDAETAVEATVKHLPLRTKREDEPIVQQVPVQMANKGTGAGGTKTNVNGKAFEAKTEHLDGFTKKHIGYEKDDIVFLKQGELKRYFKQKFNIETRRHPDEAYLIRTGDHYILIIIEKKSQNVEGSVIEKLKLGDFYQKEYADCLGSQFKIVYAYCLSAFLKKKYLSNNFKFLRKFNEQNGIVVLFGDDEDYPEMLNEFISKSVQTESKLHSSVSLDS